MVLIIDNYDSFTFNLVQYIGELGVEIRVARNDALTISDIEKMGPDGIVISPGPCTPNEAGISVELIKKFHGTIPILGVCLGHQAIGQAFGGEIVKAPAVVHGKVSTINHTGKGIFLHVPDKFSAARYHSLVIKKETSLESWKSLRGRMIIPLWASNIFIPQHSECSFIPNPLRRSTGKLFWRTL